MVCLLLLLRLILMILVLVCSVKLGFFISIGRMVVWVVVLE